MDIIDKQIELGRHKTKNLALSEKNWHDFFNVIQKKKLILYGVTKIVAFLWLRCNENIYINAAIDNDVTKKWHVLGDFFDVDNLQDSKNLVIQSKDVLKDYNPDEVVILISSMKNYEKIALELENNNFQCYFSILHLEYNYRQYMKQHNLVFADLDTYMNNFAKKCVKKNSIQNNKIIFYDMGVYLDHGKYITKQLLNMDKTFDIVWFTNNEFIDVPERVRAVKISDWKQFIYEMETAKLWIINVVPIPIYLFKRKEQICIQIKHWGSITLKKFYLDDIKDLGQKNTEFRSINFLNDDTKIFTLNGKWTDYIITGSKFDEDSCRKGFGFNGEFIRCGSPRSDILFDSHEAKNKVYNHFNLSKDEHILIYVPTYRRYDFNADLDYDALLKTLEAKWPGNWKILIRLHPFIKKESSKMELPDYVIDVSNYDDGQELVAASDVMISDYSSIMFDPAYVMKPVFLYAPDKDTYLAKDRDFLLDYNSLPFPISTTNEELSEQILNFDENNYNQKVKKFLKKYDVNEDGHASERAAKFIIDLLSEEGENNAQSFGFDSDL